MWSWISSTLQDLGRLQESEQAATKAADLMHSVHEQGKNSPGSARYADYLVLLADAQLRLGKVAMATTQIESARAIYKELLAEIRKMRSASDALAADCFGRRLSARHRTLQTYQLLGATATGAGASDGTRPTRLSEKIATVTRLRALGELARKRSPHFSRHGERDVIRSWPSARVCLQI